MARVAAMASAECVVLRLNLRVRSETSRTLKDISELKIYDSETLGLYDGLDRWLASDWSDALESVMI
jgi:hypothetical protein